MKTLLFLGFSLFTTLSFGQEDSHTKKQGTKNYIGINGGTFWVNGRQDSYSIFNMLGANYQRTLHIHFTLGVNYAQWQKWPTRFRREPVFEVLDVVDEQPRYDGLLRSRSDYKMIDIIASYNLKLQKRHTILLGTGLTKYWGTNYYYINYDTINHVSFSLAIKQKHYISTFLQLNYRYAILKDLLLLEAIVRQRYFWGLLPMETDILIGIGVTF